MNRKWSTEEVQFLKDNAHIHNDEQMARELSILGRREVTKDACRKKRQRLGLVKDAYRGFFKLRSPQE